MLDLIYGCLGVTHHKFLFNVVFSLSIAANIFALVVLTWTLCKIADLQLAH